MSENIKNIFDNPNQEESEKVENTEVQEEIVRLFANVEHQMHLEEESNEKWETASTEERHVWNEESDKLVKEQIVLRKEIESKTKGIESAYQFLDEIKLVDSHILELEKGMGSPLDFFEAKSLNLLLESVAKMREENYQAFLREIQKAPEFDSSGLFWAIKFDVRHTENLELNWPAKADATHLFACRLIGRLFINQAKQAGLDINEQTENIILRALPFASSGHEWQWKKNNKAISGDVESEQRKALDEFYKLPQAEDMGNIARSVSQKLSLLNQFRYADETISKFIQERKLDPELLGKDIKQIIRNAQESEVHGSFFGHMLPYAQYSLRDFYEKPENK